jgi:hypothetical protein
VRQFHIGAQNDALFIISGEKPAPGNDYPRHDADRTCVAKVYDEAEARRLVDAANRAPSPQAQAQQGLTELQRIEAAVSSAQTVLSRWNDWYGQHGTASPLPPAGIVQAQEALSEARSDIATLQAARAAPARPLTVEQIEELFQEAAGADEDTHIRFARAIEHALRASTAAAPSPVPAGWQLVPREPTPEMIEAASLSVNDNPERGWESRAYRAMLFAAAPRMSADGGKDIPFTAAPGAPTPDQQEG